MQSLLYLGLQAPEVEEVAQAAVVEKGRHCLCRQLLRNWPAKQKSEYSDSISGSDGIIGGFGSRYHNRDKTTLLKLRIFALEEAKDELNVALMPSGTRMAVDAAGKR